jgi:hypothetical protein
LENIFKEFTNNFVQKESKYIDKFQLKISTAEGTRINQLRYFIILLKSLELKSEVISHSLRATVLIFFARLLSNSKIRIHTVLHQLPSLSKPSQRMKRFIYSLFSDDLFTFSLAAKKDWEKNIQVNCWLKKLFKRKKINLLRNGVFLDRLPLSLPISSENKYMNLRLIFVGRPTKWKGVETVIQLMQTDQLAQAQTLFFFPYENKQLFSGLPVTVLNRISIAIGKTIGDYVPKRGDIHLYPTNYGKNVEFVESISINCLEMAAIGVPEFFQNPLITEVDWHDLNKTASTILRLQSNNILEDDIIKIRQSVTINNHINQLIKIVS